MGLYALAAWALVVFPLMRLFGKRKIFSDLRFSWLSWGLLAVAIYAALSSLLFGKDVFEIIWYPAIMGCVAGFVFALLARNTAHSEAPMSGHDLQR